jgi:hypothetical protein
MARGHLFLIVVLLSAAALAGFMAVTRSAQSSPTAKSDPAITFRLKKLDRLEASLEQQIARKKAAAQAPPTVVYQRAPAPASLTSSHGDDHENELESGGGRDD